MSNLIWTSHAGGGVHRLNTEQGATAVASRMTQVDWGCTHGDKFMSVWKCSFCYSFFFSIRHAGSQSDKICEHNFCICVFKSRACCIFKISSCAQAPCNFLRFWCVSVVTAPLPGLADVLQHFQWLQWTNTENYKSKLLRVDKDLNCTQLSSLSVGCLEKHSFWWE